MKTETKQRIEQIRRGEVPEGYKQAGQNIVPNTWNRLSFEQVAIVRSGVLCVLNDADAGLETEERDPG